MRLSFLGFYRLCVPLILSAVLAHSAFAGIRPSFSLDYCSWRATHVVLVDTTTTDGVFEVVESWKGDLGPGDAITVPELKPAPSAVPISLYPRRDSKFFTPDDRVLSTQIPEQAAGSQMVLFLKRNRASEALSTKTSASPPPEWQSSDFFGDMKASAIWIDGGRLYCFQQVINPGPSILTICDVSLTKLKDRVAEIDRIQKELAAAVNEGDGGTRAEHLKPYVRSAVLPAQEFALEELGKCGPSALATIRGMLDDPAFADEAADLIKAYVEAGGETIGEELNVRLQRDLAFWQATAAFLSQGWWNQDPTPHAPLRKRYNQTFQLILGLEHTHYSTASSTVVQLRDLWRSLPQLNDPSGLNQMAEECDKLIEHLQVN